MTGWAVRWRRRLSVAVVLAVALLAPSSPLLAAPTTSAQSGDLASALAELGLDSCADGAWDLPDGGTSEYTSCVGEIETFDGVGIDTRVTFPRASAGPLPTVLMLHGWSGTRLQWQWGPAPGAPETPAAWSRMRFVTRGYLVVATTARGFYASCGQFNVVMDEDASGGPGTADADEARCARGWTHIAERDYEVRDSQHVLGALVDAGAADPARLAATGDSYGAGQTWLLATSPPWSTPARRREIRLAAAVPFNGWTDLLDGLVPNGRATDGVDQSASHERPFGVVKSSWFSFFHQAGRVYLPPPQAPQVALTTARYNTVDPTETHSFMDGWAALFSAGEPYDTPAGEALAKAFRGKSAYYADEHLSALAARTAEPVPVFAVQGWTDSVFPAVQALQMYRKLKAAHPGYPVWLRLGDVGHGGRSPAAEVREVHEEAGQFLDSVLTTGAADVPLARVASYATECTSDLPPRREAGSWDALTNGLLSLRADGTRRTTSAPGRPDESAASDPVLQAVRGTSGCVVLPAPSAGTGEWISWDTGGASLLGLPVLRASYEMTGADATLVATLWDVAPDGRRTLVTRGVHRLSVAGGDAARGAVALRMFGNHWVFRPGHRIAVELSQADPPFLRPDSTPSTVTWSGLSLDLPLAAGPRPSTSTHDGQVAGSRAPAGAALPPLVE